jgi:hypothetical protein
LEQSATSRYRQTYATHFRLSQSDDFSHAAPASSALVSAPVALGLELGAAAGAAAAGRFEGRATGAAALTLGDVATPPSGFVSDDALSAGEEPVVSTAAAGTGAGGAAATGVESAGEVVAVA